MLTCFLSLTLALAAAARAISDGARFDHRAIARALVSDAELLTVAPVAPAATAERPPSLRPARAARPLRRRRLPWRLRAARVGAGELRAAAARVRLCEDGVYKMHAKQGPRTRLRADGGDSARSTPSTTCGPRARARSSFSRVLSSSLCVPSVPSSHHHSKNSCECHRVASCRREPLHNLPSHLLLLLRLLDLLGVDVGGVLRRLLEAAEVERRKYLMAWTRPSSSGTLGSHPRKRRAFVMSGRRCFGSSPGSGMWITFEDDPVCLIARSASA